MRKDLHDLLDEVIAQIRVDLEGCDCSALAELLLSCPRRSLEAYLPEVPSD